MSKHCWTLKDRYESQFSAAFYPMLLSDTKRAEIIHRAEEIRAVRNDISDVFFSDMLGFQDMSKYEAFNFFNPTFNTLNETKKFFKIRPKYKIFEFSYNKINNEMVEISTWGRRVELKAPIIYYQPTDLTSLAKYRIDDFLINGLAPNRMFRDWGDTINKIPVFNKKDFEESFTDLFERLEIMHNVMKSEDLKMLHEEYNKNIAEIYKINRNIEDIKKKYRNVFTKQAGLITDFK